MHVRKSRSQWSSIIAAFERSGETHLAFCSKRGINVGSFRTWLYRLRLESCPSRGAPMLLPVEVTAPLAVHDRSDIVVAVAGVEVRVAVGADIGYVAGLVAELRSRC